MLIMFLLLIWTYKKSNVSLALQSVDVDPGWSLVTVSKSLTPEGRCQWAAASAAYVEKKG